jgi:hypothetical protein
MHPLTGRLCIGIKTRYQRIAKCIIACRLLLQQHRP